MIEGVDYAFSVPSVNALVSAGKKFVVRYGGPGSAGKQLQSQELDQLKSHGIPVVANAEGSAGGFRGYAAGRDWANKALSHFALLEMPDDRPIYFSVDWNANSSDWSDIDNAIQGAASVIGFDRVGIYGSYATISHCANKGVRWLWQTYAWSSGKIHPDVNLYQYHNGVSIGGGDTDLDRAYTEDYGQWGVPMDISAKSMQALTDLIQAPYQNTAPNGEPSETQVGHVAGVQRWPDQTEDGAPLVPYYVAFGNAVKVLMAVSDKLDEIVSLLKAV